MPKDPPPIFCGSPRRGLIGATLGFFIGFAAIALFGVTAQAFKAPLNLSPVGVGWLVATPSLFGSLLRIPFSAWVDADGGRRPLLVLLGLSLLGMSGLTLVSAGFYPNRLTPAFYPWLLALGALAGCGAATFSVGISQTSYWFPRARQGAALGTYGGLGNLAPGLFTLLLPIALTNWGLTGSYLAWWCLLAAGAWVYALIAVNAPYFQLRKRGLPPDRAQALALQAGQELFPAGSARQGLLLACKNWRTWALVGAYFTTQGGFLTLTAWLPTYWNAFFGFSLAQAGLLTALFSLFTSLVRIAGGLISDRVGGAHTAYLALGALAAGALVMTLSAQAGWSVAGEILLGLGMGVGNAAVFKLAPQAEPRAVGGASGWVGGIGAFGGFVFPPILGNFVQREGPAGYAHGFAIFIGLAILSIGAIRLIERAQPPRGSVTPPA